MKKIVLTVLALLAFGGQRHYAQSIATRNAVKATYDISKASTLVRAYADKAQDNKERAYKEASVQNKPISGVNERGNYFELSGVEENGLLLYKTTLNAGSRITARAEDIPVIDGATAFLDGEGMLVGVVDGMALLDTHQEFYRSKGDQKSRVTLMDAVPSVPFTFLERRNYERSRSHATHVGGTIAGGGWYENRAKGIAPKTELWSYSWNQDLEKMSEMASSGILLSNHSYGYDFFDDDGFLVDEGYVNYFGAYMNTSRDFDQIAVLYPYYQPVVAAGNDGEFHDNVYKDTAKKDCNCDLLNGTSVAKNAVVVAAVEDVPLYVDASSVRIASFSSQGPTNDFRIKPDIAAKGYKVFSTVYKIPTTIGVQPATNYYAMSSGTSMAAPAVTGVFALWQQWAIKNAIDGKPFTSATIRALMAHTADEAGEAPGPDHVYGWGLINAKAGVDVMLGAKDDRSATILEQVLLQGQTFKKEIVVTKPMSKLVVTLAWTDPAGKVTNQNIIEDVMRYKSMLVNDLNVVVKKGKQAYYPWRLNKNFQDLKAVQGVNDTDNIEKIELFDVLPGTYTIEVSHRGSLQDGKQAYSLVSTVGEFDALEKMEEVAKAEDFKIWPNPVLDQLHITVGDQYNGTAVAVRIFDISGRLVQSVSNTVEEGMGRFNVNQLEANVYVVEIKTHDRSKTVRIAKR
ncbi:S8/S53 family peptidase [Myroides odoratimimus]|uniref:S8/S53 family peptidase n=1 Tax=Myroides odoratimimus TaxID=76832 RepID=UPI001CE10E58|nr:S8/S53 family peptidase [Myroides odoratimimus]MCA4806974.1 S8 family peptidase [Myroides odoratimimus]